jgi:hypothetical protein
MAIEPCTFNFKASLSRSLPWDAVTQAGQTVKVILDGKKHRNVMNSVSHWNRKMDGKLRLILKVRAQTFMIYEAIIPEPAKKESITANPGKNSIALLVDDDLPW